MIDFARGMIRPRQFKLTRIKEIVLSSRQTSEKYIKLVFRNKRKGKGKGSDETLKFIFDDDSLFSIWTLALSALVYIWKWLEMPENRKQGKDQRGDDAGPTTNQTQIHELGPTGKQLVADLLCSLISRDRVQKKHLTNVSKLLTELDFWCWAPHNDPRRQLVLQYLSDLSDDDNGAEEDDKENSVDSDSSSISRRHSAPIILSKLNDLYTIPEDLDQSNQVLRTTSQENDCNGLLLGASSSMSPSKSQKIFERVSNCIVEYIESSDSEDLGCSKKPSGASSSCSSGDERNDDREELAMHTQIVHPVTALALERGETSDVHQEVVANMNMVEKASTSTSASGSSKVDKERIGPIAKDLPQPADKKRDADLPLEEASGEANEGQENNSSKDFFSALNILERKSKWKRRLKHMKNVVLETLNGVESGVSALEERIQTSDLQRHYKGAAKCKEKAHLSSIVDQDVFKAAMWRSIIQLSIDLQSEKDKHQETLVKLASVTGEASVQDSISS